MNKVLKSTGYGLIADLAFGIAAALIIVVSVFLANLHPLSTFLQETSLLQVQANPDLLPHDSVLYTGAITYIVLTILAILAIVLFFIFTRYLLYHQILKKKQASFWRVLLRALAGIFLVLIPGIFIVGVISFIINLIFSGLNFITGLPLFRYLGAAFSLFLMIVLLVICVLYFRQVLVKTSLDSFLSLFSYFKTKYLSILLVALIITAVSLLLQLIGANVLSQYFREGYSVWYITTSLILFAWLRAKTLSFA